MLLCNTPVAPNSINRQAQAQFPSPSVALRVRVVSKLSHGLFSFGDTNFWGSGRGTRRQLVANGKSRRDLPFVMIVTRDVTQPTG